MSLASLHMRWVSEGKTWGGLSGWERSEPCDELASSTLKSLLWRESISAGTLPEDRFMGREPQAVWQDRALGCSGTESVIISLQIAEGCLHFSHEL